MVGTPRILTQERVAEINARIGQRGWAIFFDALLGDNSKRTSKVSYAATDDRFSALQALLKVISEGQDIRYVESARENWDLKRFGGFSPLVTTRQAYFRRSEPPFIDTNVAIWGVDVGNLKVLFFPDTLLIFNHEQYQMVPYESLSVRCDAASSVESSPPRNAKIVDYTWLYTNIDGGPDRRYSDNRRLPIVLYYLVRIESTSGLSIQLLISDETLAVGFSATFQDILQLGSTHRESTEGNHYGRSDRKRDGNQRSSSSQRRPPRIPDRPASRTAREILGVPPNATKSEVTAAYRRKALMYHPDKVEGLGPEFSELAELRMKEINAAYTELLKAAKQ